MHTHAATKIKVNRKFVLTHLACAAVIFVSMATVFVAQYKNVTSPVPEVDNFLTFPDYRVLNGDFAASLFSHIYPTLYYSHQYNQDLVPISPIWWSYTFLSIFAVSAAAALIPAKVLSDVIYRV